MHFVQQACCPRRFCWSGWDIGKTTKKGGSLGRCQQVTRVQRRGKNTSESDERADHLF